MSAYFEYYKVFYYVALCRSITGAAEKLSLTQPSVTRAIKNLESQLGVALFSRSKQGVSLTPEGARLYDRVMPACKLLFSAEEEILRLKSLEIGQVRIGADSSIVRSGQFLNALHQFRKRYPQIQLCVEYTSVHYQKELAEGSLDCCFLSGQSDMTMAPGLCRQKLYTYDDVIVVGPKYTFLAEHELTLSDLADCPRILFGQSAIADAFPPSDPDSDFFSLPAPILAGSLDFQIQLAKAGFGYTFVPRICVEEDIRSGALISLRLKDVSLCREVELITPTERSLSYAAQHFIQLVQEEEFSAVP